MMSIQETLRLTIIQLLLIFIFPIHDTFSQPIHLQYLSQGIELKSAEGRIVILQANADDDEDGILNSLEVEGFTYSPNQGLRPWDGDPNQRYFKTDPLRWSTDGDPYSDYMEVTGVNIPAGIPSPENHPLVAARPVININMTDYDVILISEITNMDGGVENTSFTNETSSTHEVGGEVTVEASLNPFKLASASVTASYSHTWSRMESTTSSLGTNWSNTRSTNTSQAARLRLHVYMQNLGSATALDVKPTFNLVLGEKTIATITPNQIAERLAPKGLPNSRYPESGTIAIDKDDQGNDIILSLEELKAIQSGAPLGLAVTQVSADVARWNSATQSYDSREEWSSFEGEIDPVVVTIKANFGDDDIRQYQIYTGTDYYNLGYNFRDVLSTIFNVEEYDGVTFIDGRQYPDQWYVSTSSEKIIQEWNRQGQPQNLLNLPMIRNTQIVLMTPGTQPQANIDFAIFDPEYKKIYVSAFPGNFPILNVRAQVTIDGSLNEIELVADNSSFYTNRIPFESPAHPDGLILVENARGDISTSKIMKPALYKDAAEVKQYSTFLPNPGSEYFLFAHNDPDKPVELYCQFFDLFSGTPLEEPREYLTLCKGNEESNFIDYREAKVHERVYFDKVRIDPYNFIVDCSDLTFTRKQSLGEMSVDIESKEIYWGSIHYNLPSSNQIQALANINLTGTPFSLNSFTDFVDDSKDVDCEMSVDKFRQLMNINCSGISTELQDRIGYSGIMPGNVSLIYNRNFFAGEGLKLPGNSIELNLSNNEETGYVNMGETEALNVNETVTLEAWIKLEIQEQSPDHAGVIFNKNDEYGFLLFPDGTIRWRLNTTGLWENIKNTCFQTGSDQWVHIALTYDRNNYFINMYLDGNLFQRAWAVDPVGWSMVNQENFLVGIQELIPNLTNHFAGSIDELRIWNIVRTEEQIRETMYTPLDPNIYSSPDSGLIGYWRFDELEDLGVGNAGVNDVRDYSVNHNHGDVIGDAHLSDNTACIRDFLFHN